MSTQGEASWAVTLFGAVVLALAMASIAANWLLDQDQAGAAWVQTPGSVTVSRLEQKSAEQQRAVVVASFEADGRSWKANNGSLGIAEDDALSPAGVVERYPLGTTVVVWHDPGSPANAHLRQPESPSPTRYIVGAALAVVLLGGFVRWRARAHRD